MVDSPQGRRAQPRLPIADTVGQRSSTDSMTRRRRPVEGAIRTFLLLCGLVSILVTVGFSLVLGQEAFNFFTNYEWLSTNKGLAAAVDAAQTTLRIPTTGSPIVAGDLVRIGIGTQGEVVEVTTVLDAETLEVTRGALDTTPSEHAANAPLFTGKRPTLTEFFTGTRWSPQIGNFGVLPLLTATLSTSLIGMLVAVPVGLGAAIYLSEYASTRVRKAIKPLIEILAGVPTVVYGYFALTFVTPFLRGLLGSDTVQVYNMASAGIVIGVLIIPTIASISEDALRAVPIALREASMGLGATRLETVYKVLLPAALSGISAALILGISRAVGETMIVLIAAGAGPNFTLNPFDNAETMAGHIARISTGDISRGSIDYNSIFAVGMTLFLMTLILNVVSSVITRRFREQYS
jgi:phosphate transport system permease protein